MADRHFLRVINVCELAIIAGAVVVKWSVFEKLIIDATLVAFGIVMPVCSLSRFRKSEPVVPF